MNKHPCLMWGKGGSIGGRAVTEGNRGRFPSVRERRGPSRRRAPRSLLCISHQPRLFDPIHARRLVLLPRAAAAARRAEDVAFLVLDQRRAGLRQELAFGG